MNIFFEDIFVGAVRMAGPYEALGSEMNDIAVKWDPLPIHLSSGGEVHGGVIASGLYTLAIKQKLLIETGFVGSHVIGAIGWNDLRFPTPVRPGDQIVLSAECVAKRESRSKPDRGIVEFQITLKNQRQEEVLSYRGLVMMKKRGALVPDVLQEAFL